MCCFQNLGERILSIGDLVSGTETLLYYMCNFCVQKYCFQFTIWRSIIASDSKTQQSEFSEGKSWIVQNDSCRCNSRIVVLQHRFGEAYKICENSIDNWRPESPYELPYWSEAWFTVVAEDALIWTCSICPWCGISFRTGFDLGIKIIACRGKVNNKGKCLS